MASGTSGNHPENRPGLRFQSGRYRKLELRLQRGRVFLAYLLTEFEASKFAKCGTAYDGDAVGLVRRVNNEFDDNSARVLENARNALFPSSNTKV